MKRHSQIYRTIKYFKQDGSHPKERQYTNFVECVNRPTKYIHKMIKPSYTSNKCGMYYSTYSQNIFPLVKARGQKSCWVLIIYLDNVDCKSKLWHGTCWHFMYSYQGIVVDLGSRWYVISDFPLSSTQSQSYTLYMRIRRHFPSKINFPKNTMYIVGRSDRNSHSTDCSSYLFVVRNFKIQIKAGRKQLEFIFQLQIQGRI